MIRNLLVVPRSVVLVLAAMLLGHAAQARILEVGEGKEFKLPSEAVKAARAGDTVQLQPGEYFDCAVLSQSKLVFEGVGDASKVLMTDKTCGGKALLITTGADITVRNLTLTRARVPDANGAGIRGEGANLLVENVRFINNQNGILSGTDDATITVRNSYFDRNGTCEQACSHGIYVGRARLLRVENTTFEDTRQGHHIKSRALRTEVIGCTLDDGEEGTASYMIEVPNGGSLLVKDSTLTKGAAVREPYGRDRDRHGGGEPAHAGDYDHQQHLQERRRLPHGLRMESKRHRRDADRQQDQRPGEAAARRWQGDALGDGACRAAAASPSSSGRVSG